MTSYRWFRLHSEVRNDAKLRAIPYDERWVFLCLLCFASEQEERGVIPPMSTFRLAAEVADGDKDLLDRTLAHLQELDIVRVTGDGAIQFLHWRERQYDHPSDAPEAAAARKARQRQRLAAQNPHADNENDGYEQDVPMSGGGDVTSMSRAGHEGVTSRSRHVTSMSRPCHEDVTTHTTDTDTETETELSTAAASIARARARVGEALGEITDVERDVVQYLKAVPGLEHVPDAALLAKYREVVQQRGPRSPAAERLEAMKFRDYWSERRKGRRDRWRNWKLAMANWFIRTKEVDHAVNGRGPRADRTPGGGSARTLPARPAVDYDRYARYVQLE